MEFQKREASDWLVGIKQIENNVNERPLCAMSDNEKDLDHVVPSQFAPRRSREEQLNSWAKECMINWKKYMLETADEKNEKSVGEILIVYENGLRDEEWTVARVMKFRKESCKLRDKNGRYWNVPNEWFRSLIIYQYAEFLGELEEYLRPIDDPPGLCVGMNEGLDELE